MAAIMRLTQDMVREMFDYRADGKLVRRYSVMGKSNHEGRVIGTTPDGTRSHRYSSTKINGQHWSVHRLIYLHQCGIVPDQLDHINGDSSDNRIENLRPADSTQNASNRSLFVNNTSGKKGVSYHKASGLWYTYVNVNKKRKHLGYYADVEIAGMIASKARDYYHGSFTKHT